ncbi:TIGR03986 family type III CRISPR-associated RAMP protein [Salinactinospora qingdaonensis]|uniref:CRISPR type III-associated protein domain-containing protein n=1 Tax=Salinactinospora qingdaonensis TaxID=702744 RepID=A0ABP7FUD2_9ACTN
MSERRDVPNPGQVGKKIAASRQGQQQPRPAPPTQRTGQSRPQRSAGPNRPAGRQPSAGSNQQGERRVVDPGPGHDHGYRAVSPYGLVPLSERPMPAERLHSGLDVSQGELLRSHDRRVPGTHTGWIEVDIRNLTPLFVGATQEEEREQAARSLTIDGSPAIPGASLRGMVRNYLRMFTGGETGPVNTPQLFFRAPASSHRNDRARTVMRGLKEQYTKKRHGIPPSPPWQPVTAGFLRHEADGWRIHPLALDRPLQIRLSDLKQDFENCFPEDFPSFELPPIPGVQEQDKVDNYVPGEFHREFQYLKVVALCPEVEVNPRNPLYEYNFRAMAVLPEGESMEEGDEGDVRERLQKHWSGRLEKARREAEKRGKRGPELLFTKEPHEIVSIRQIPAVLVLTGITGERKNAYLFPTEGTKPPLPVPESLVRMVDSADQVTQFQQRNFTDEVAVGGKDPQRRKLREGTYGTLARNADEPVWYQVEEGEVVSFGRAGSYRVAVRGPETNPIRDAVPGEVFSPENTDREGRGRRVDVPRAIFGDIDLFDERVPAARGRVSFGNAVSTDSPYEFENPLRVELLKPGRTCFTNYVLQPAGNRWGEEPDLVTWAHEGTVDLNGYKIYLHRHDEQTDRYAELHPDQVEPGDTKRDVLPLRSGLTFRGRITFSNLTDAELGALMRVLLLDNPADGGPAATPSHAHRIGMGKTLGMGSVHIRPRLHLVNHEERLTSLDPHAGIHEATEGEVRGYLDAFDTALLSWEQEQAELPSNGSRPKPAPPKDWRSVERVNALLLAARWRDRLPYACTRPMELDEFALYPVLPTIVERFDHCGTRG